MKSFLLFVLCFLCAHAAIAQTAQPGTWIPNGRVKNITRGDGKIFLSGDFNWFGEYYGGAAAVLNTDLSHDSSYPKVLFPIESAIPDGAGGWYTITYGLIGHIKADKTLETLPFMFNSSGAPVFGVALIGNILYVGGQFNTVNGTARQNLAAIDLTTNTLTSWNPGANSSVFTIKAFGSTLYIGGSFTAAGGQVRQRIAAIDATTGLASSWNANVLTSGFGYVLKIIPTATTIYFGGSFVNAGGGSPSRTNFAAVNTTTGALTTFNPRPDGIVRELLLDGTTLYICGDFLQIGGISKYGIAAFDTGTGLVTLFDVAFPNTYNGPVATLAVDGQKLFVGGDFRKINGAEKARLAVVDKTTGVLQPTVPRNVSDAVLAISVSGTKVLIGFYSLNGITGDFSNLQFAALDETSGQGLNWTPQIPPPPTDWYISDTHLQYQSNRVYYWQDREYPIDGLSESIIGAVNSSDGSAIPGFAVGVIGVVDAWAFTTTTLYLAGDFTMINGTPRSGFAAVNISTGALLPFTIPFAPNYVNGEEINSLAVYNNVLYVGGSFEFTDGGVTRTNLAAWDATSGVIQPWAPQVTLPDFSQVRVGAVHNGRVYLIGGVCIRVDAITGLADTWTPDYYNAIFGPDDVESIVIEGNYAYIAGQFSPGLARVGLGSGSRSTWQPELDDVYDSEGEVIVLAVSESQLFVGGNFSFNRADGNHSYYAQYDLPVEVANEPPQIASIASAILSDNLVTIDLTPLISDADDNLDLTTLHLLSETSDQGAAASLNDLTLVLDYGGPFSGTDHVSLEVCDLLEACTQQQLEIHIGGTDLVVYNAVSPNNDGKNEEFVIEFINLLPDTKENKLTILNRWGSIVFEASNYDNIANLFRGLNQSGTELPTGTYYYKLEFPGGAATKTGFISLKR